MGCVQFQAGARDFSLRKVVYMGSGTCLASYSVVISGTFPRGKADQSPPSSAEVNNEWSHIPFPSQYAVCCIIKQLLYQIQQAYRMLLKFKVFMSATVLLPNNSPISTIYADKYVYH